MKTEIIIIGIVAELQPSGKKIFYHDDHLGSTTLITNQSGSVVENTSYAPFGEILSGGNTSRFDYEGKEFSSGSGGYGEGTQDYDFKFRKYDPGLKIFTKPEQELPKVYDPQQLNRYAFERNNPYVYVDENGKVAIRVYASGELVYGNFGGYVGAGPVYVFSKENGFQYTYTSSYGGGINTGALAGTSFNVEITPSAKKVSDVTGRSVTEGIAVARGFGGGASFSRGQQGPDSYGFELIAGLSARGYVYLTDTIALPVLIQIDKTTNVRDLFVSQREINQRKQVQQMAGCNPAVQSCARPQPSSGSGEGRSSGGSIFSGKKDDSKTPTSTVTYCDYVARLQRKC